MKKLFLLISFIIFGLSTLSADEYVVTKFKCLAADGLYEREIDLKYDDKENVYYLFSSSYSTAYWFILSPEKLEKLRSNLQKVQDWSKLAKENKSSISKELPDSKISIEGIMLTNNDWYTTRWDIPLNFFFVSQINEGAEIISLLIRGGAAESRQNEFIDIEFDSIIFINNQIDEFINAISSETIETGKNNHKEQKKAAEMFN